MEDIVDKHVPQKIVDAHDTPADGRWNPFTEIKKGSVVTVVVSEDGKEVWARKYWQGVDEATGKMRVYEVNFQTTITNKPAPAEEIK